jgi:hypothetical protein
MPSSLRTYVICCGSHGEGRTSTPISLADASSAHPARHNAEERQPTLTFVGLERATRHIVVTHVTNPGRRALLLGAKTADIMAAHESSDSQGPQRP